MLGTVERSGAFGRRQARGEVRAAPVEARTVDGVEGVEQHVRGEQLVVCIIDFLRQYTWDKQLETWVKSSGIVGGTSKGAPTVTSPVHYMERFRKQMASYFRIMPSRFDPPSSEKA